MCLNAGGQGRQDSESETLIAHALRGEGFDASEDGTGRGVPIVPIAFTQNSRSEVREIDGDGSIVGALASDVGAQQQNYIAFSAKDYGADAGDIAPTLRAGGHSKSHANAGVMPAIAFSPTESFSSGNNVEIAPTLRVGTGKRDAGEPPAVVTAMRVRRLTPRECERLQGFPDDYTRIPGAANGGWRDLDEGEDIEELKALGLAVRLRGNTWRVKDPDGPRYKSLGNSMAVPVMGWLGRRIAAHVA